MARYFLELSYNGANFAGWQIQNNSVTVQGKLNDGLSLILRQEVETIGAGRTDAGVHARQQFVHFDYDGELTTKLVSSLNSILPRSIAIKNIFLAPSDFHARFNAILRGYEYHIVPHKSVFNTETKLWLNNFKQLDIEKLQNSAQVLLEYQDFASFCKAHGNNKTTLCNLVRSEWQFQIDTEENIILTYFVESDRFLRGMVRALVGTMLNVGLGKINIHQFREIIELRNRNLAGRNVEAHGLFLAKVQYPEGFLELLKK